MLFKEYLNESNRYISESVSAVEYDGVEYPLAKRAELDKDAKTSVSIDLKLINISNMTSRMMLSLYKREDGTYQGLKSGDVIKFDNDEAAARYLISLRINKGVVSKFVNSKYK